MFVLLNVSRVSYNVQVNGSSRRPIHKVQTQVSLKLFWSLKIFVKFLGDDFVSTFWGPIWWVWRRFFHEIVSGECDLSDGERWECVTIVRLTKWDQSRHTNLTTWSQNLETGKLWFCRKRNILFRFVPQKIKTVTKSVKIKLNFINFDEILYFSNFVT